MIFIELIEEDRKQQQKQYQKHIIKPKSTISFYFNEWFSDGIMMIMTTSVAIRFAK